MTITNLSTTLRNFLRLTITRYLGINLMRNNVEDIFNYLQLDENIATGGQPAKKQFTALKNAGYKTIINLALPTSENALPNEKAIVEGLGMNYIHIPINFNHPTERDFTNFCEAMQTYRQQKTFVHCAANLRVSAFMYLYRVLDRGVSKTTAKQDLNKLWQPDKTWQNLIDKIMAKNSQTLSLSK